MHDQERQADRVGEQRLVLGVGAVGGVDDRVRHVHVERLLAPRSARDDAAAATVLALEQDGPAIYNIVDDEPAPVREWLPVLAQALDAKPPRR